MSISTKQILLILGLGVSAFVVPTTVGLCLMCAAVGAFVSVVLA